MKGYRAIFSENGRRMEQVLYKEDATERYVVDWFGLENPDIDWYRLEKID